MVPTGMKGMALGFGFLKNMNDTVKYNRSLLGSKKSPREKQNDEIRQRAIRFDARSLDFVRARVSASLKRSRVEEFITRAAALLAIVGLMVGGAWALSTSDFSTERVSKYANPSQLFTTYTYVHPNGMDQKTDYFPHGTKAAETFLKNGLKHQNSESYYQSGEQFRSALYDRGTLITEVYLYRTGDTIAAFPALSSDVVYAVKLQDPKRAMKIEFDFYDGKVVPDSYRESTLTQ